MVYAVQADLNFRTVARRDAAQTAVESHLGTKPVWGSGERTRAVAAGAVRPGKTRANPSLIVGARFINQADADAFYNNADTYFGTGTNGPQSGSRLKQHPCSHDDPNPQPCVDTRVRVW